MIEVHHRPTDARFDVAVDGAVVGFAEYRDTDGVRAFVHTVVDRAFQGRGLAEKLVLHALNETRREGRYVQPFCSYVRDVIARHDEYLDLVPQMSRSGFGLPEQRRRAV
ncbi:MAG TPA: GNAT family N-acetyltransferase [Actinomycetota bacterium]|nr:GNAT family N-acetyltransferase [Actinomycetota bacterium]